MAKRHPITGKYLFWTAIIFVLLLAIYTIIFNQVTQYSANDLGLLTKLPMTFWIGLSSLGILLYFGRNSGLRIIVVAVLISFYLFGVPVLMSETKAIFFGGISYFYSYKGPELLSIGHLQFSSLYSLDWLNWPGFFILAGFLSASTGLPVTLFADYFPLLTMALLGILAYETLRLRLNTLSSALGALWFIASFWTSQQYFSPQGIAYVIYFAFFLLLAKLFFSKKKNIVIPLIVIFLFIGLVTTHLLTSFAALVGVLAVYTLSKIFTPKHKMAAFYSISTCIFLIVIFFAYQALVTQSLSGVAEVLFSQFSRGETHLSVIAGERAAESPALQLTILGSYGITIINVVIALIAILTTVLLILRYKKEEAKDDLFWVAWIIAAGIIVASVFYGGEAIERAFVIMLLPTSYFAAKLLSKKPQLLVFLLIILVFFQMPALYCSQNYIYSSRTEFKGGDFYTKYAPSNAPFFYEPNLAYFGPGNRGPQLFIQQIAGLKSIPSPELVNYTVGQADFILSSSEQKNFYQYYYEVDVLENLSLDNHYNRLYDNGGFQTYGQLSG
jgi:hypothetical protein